MRDYFEEMLEPTDKLTTVTRIVTVLWLAVLMIQVVVWLIIGVVGGFDSPWWLWTVAGGGLVVGVLHLLARGLRQQ
jgi:membrane protein YdbS with pleckstrin-like domain